MKRHALKNIMAAAAVTVSALLVQGCDVMWGTAIDSDPYYDGGYYGDGYYGTGFYNNWSPTIHHLYSVKPCFIYNICISVICRCFHLV